VSCLHPHYGLATLANTIDSRSLLLENQLYLPCLPPHIAENTKKKRKLMMIDITTSTVRWQPTALYVDDLQLLCLIIRKKNFHIPNLMSL